MVSKHEPRYPEIHVPMIGHDGNAFAVLGSCRRAAERAGLPKAEWDAFQAEATSGDYDHLLQTVLVWFAVDGDDPLERGD